eukprot:GGOE01018145.1.p2 GENE.GGOE01018145.1~~GGOE01018145.1.p2  ORF type:complete len:124 (+),score=28.84 GGOE01018145.1:831-1202(+)
MIDWLMHEGHPYKFILTKTDKLNAHQLSQQIDRISAALKVPREAVIPTSAETGAGIKEVLRHVATMYHPTVERLKKLEQLGYKSQGRLAKKDPDLFFQEEEDAREDTQDASSDDEIPAVRIAM